MSGVYDDYTTSADQQQQLVDEASYLQVCICLLLTGGGEERESEWRGNRQAKAAQEHRNAFQHSRPKRS